ncbi:hypothetical protein [Bradyrhizobium sp. STM 3809]|uniref:hypothetical protein n=1 Tax=Bradyrhizobium sp. STM 3809 TaxID=551936 RepID=UPI0002408E7C|nr:hypothetical protein [Bradyrhizobium sp. STM 3809]CCE01154.1 conserved hypothetical protein [Bradyrhizobium sp. STM 3809]
MTEQRTEFGKRRPLPPPPATPPVKRSGHVALLVMGTLAVGGTAYALMPHQQSCPQDTETPTMAAQPQTGECSTRHSSGSGGSHGGGSGRWGFSGGDSESSRSGSTHIADASSAHVSRGGFGGFAHVFGFGRGG